MDFENVQLSKLSSPREDLQRLLDTVLQYCGHCAANDTGVLEGSRTVRVQPVNYSHPWVQGNIVVCFFVYPVSFLVYGVLGAHHNLLHVFSLRNHTILVTPTQSTGASQ